MRKLIVVLILLFVNASFGAEWLELYSKTYLDTESIKFYYSQQKVSFWLKVLNNGKIEPFEGKKVWYAMTKNTIDCANNKIRNDAFWLYDLKGSQIGGTSIAEESFGDIIPGTQAEDWAYLTCRLMNTKPNKINLP